MRWEWRWWHERICKVGGPSRFGERNYLQSASTCKTSRGLRRRHRSCRNLCLIWKNKAPLSWFEYSKLCKKSDGSLKKNFLSEEYSNGSDWKRFLFRWRTDDNTEEGKRNRDDSKRELLTCMWRRARKEELWGVWWRWWVVEVASKVQKLLEDWLSSSSSRGSLGQVTRGMRQRLGRSSYQSWVWTRIMNGLWKQTMAQGGLACDLSVLKITKNNTRAIWSFPRSENMRTSGNVGNLPHLRCWRTGKRTLTEPLESLRPTEMCFFTQSIHFDHFWTRLYNKALTSLTRDSPRCRLPRVEILPVPMKRDEVSSKAEISAIRFSFCAKVVENRIEKKKTRRRKKRQTSSFILLRRSLLSRRSLSRVPRVWALLLPSPATWPSTIKHDIATILIGFWKHLWVNQIEHWLATSSHCRCASFSDTALLRASCLRWEWFHWISTPG